MRRIERILELASGGVLVLVTGAVPARLRELVLALTTALEGPGGRARGRSGRRPAGVRVCLRAAEVMVAAEGSTLVLRLDEADSGWLNEHRPLFAERRLRVILWAEGQAGVALRGRAPDFFDWISHVVECPGGVPAFALAGLRLAPAYPGIAWRGGDLDAALAAAFPGEPVTRVSAAAPYGELVDAAASTPGWLVWTGVAMPRELVRIRWSLAESGRSGRVVIEEPGCPAPGWWPASAACLSWAQAADMLARNGLEHPGLLAALLDLEPAALRLAIDLAPMERLARHRAGDEGERAGTLLDDLRGLAADGDPGAHLARVSARYGLVDRGRVVRLSDPPPVLRAFHEEAGVGAYRRAVAARVDQALRTWSDQMARDAALPSWTVDAGDLAVWAGMRPAAPPPLPRPCPAHPAVAYWLEAALIAARAAGAAVDWNAAVELAIWIGQYDIACHWAEAHEVDARVRAVALHQQGRYGEAEHILRQALARSDPGAAPAVHAPVQVLLAATLKEQGAYPEAERILRQCADQDPEGGAALHLLAEVLAAQGKHAEAEELFLRSIARIERGRGPGDPLHGMALHDLAGVLQQQGRLEDAEARARQALDSKRGTHGPEHPSFTATLELLAGILAARGEHRQAEDLYRRSMEIESRQTGTEHPRHTRALSELGLVLGRQGKYDEAEHILRESLASAESALGAGHPVHAVALRNLSVLLAERGEYAEAEALLRRALDIQERVFGAEHLEVADTLSRLALVLARQDRSAEAGALARRARGIVEARASAAHPVAAEIAALLAGV